MQQSSRTVPVVFIAGSDPVVDGLVQSLANPGGNLTGFYVFEPSLGAVNLPTVFGQSAAYVDQILKGTKPGDLPVFLPTKFELVINLTTAKALGISVPLALMLRADEMVD